MKILSLAAAIACGALASPMPSIAQEVDFSQKPKSGLKTKITMTQSSTGSQQMSMGEREFGMTFSTTRKEIYTQTLVEVTDGKIMKLERNYEDSGSTLKATVNGDEREPQERESPLAWKHVRIVWSEDGDATATVKEDDEWVEPEGSVKKSIRPKRWRRGPPLPTGTKKVGESWEVSGEEAHKLFGMQARTGPDGEEVPLPDMTARFELASMATLRDMPCAVLKMEMTSEREGSKSTTRATLHYSLEHRVIVQVESSGEESGSREREGPDGATVHQERSGTNKQKITVEILEAGKDA